MQTTGSNELRKVTLPFVGRKQEAAQLHRLHVQRKHALILVPAGVGKSALATCLQEELDLLLCAESAHLGSICASLEAGLDAASVLLMFGAMQMLTGVVYRMPMPVQPLQAVTVLVITQKRAPNLAYGAGLAIGVVMLVLTLTGLLSWLARLVPKCVVRAIQFGLDIQLVRLALKDYARADGGWVYVLAGTAFGLALVLAENRRLPAALAVIGVGLAYAQVVHAKRIGGGAMFGFRLPQPHVPTWVDVWTDFLALARCGV